MQLSDYFKLHMWLIRYVCGLVQLQRGAAERDKSTQGSTCRQSSERKGHGGLESPTKTWREWGGADSDSRAGNTAARCPGWPTLLEVKIWEETGDMKAQKTGQGHVEHS